MAGQEPVESRILTHRVNFVHPDTGKQVTFDPGDDLPKWAQEIILNDPLASVYPITNPRAEALVLSWKASVALAETQES